MALLPSLEALGRRNVAGPLLLLNLALYLSMMALASWALNAFVDARHHQEQEYYPPPADYACMCMDHDDDDDDAPPAAAAGDEAATLQFLQSALLAAVLGFAAKATAAFHARASWRPQGLAAATALATVAWAATALAFGLACKEMRLAAAARGWRMRALEGVTAVLAFTQLVYVIMLHNAAAAPATGGACDEICCEPGCPGGGGDACEPGPGCSTTEGDGDGDGQGQQPHAHGHSGGGPSCSVM